MPRLGFPNLTRRLRLSKSDSAGDAASAIEGGADVRTALVTFGIDASHGYERVHENALFSVARLLKAYALSPVEIERDAEPSGDLEGFTDQPTEPAETDPAAE